MTSLFFASLLLLITLPFVILLYVTATPQEHAKRLRKSGHTYAAIANRFKVSPSTARRWCLA